MAEVLALALALAVAAVMVTAFALGRWSAFKEARRRTDEEIGAAVQQERDFIAEDSRRRGAAAVCAEISARLLALIYETESTRQPMDLAALKRIERDFNARGQS